MKLIPVVIADAGIEVGVTTMFASIIDIVPTACYLLDMPAPAQAEDRVLWLELKWKKKMETTEAVIAA